MRENYQKKPSSLKSMGSQMMQTLEDLGKMALPSQLNWLGFLFFKKQAEIMEPSGDTHIVHLSN